MTFVPRTWLVGEVVAAATLNTEIRDQFNSMFAAWTAYTPVWTTSGTAPALGNGTLTGRYLKIGRTVIVHVSWTAGSSTAYGTGNYNFTVPFAAAAAGASLIGHAHLLGTARWVGQVVLSPSATTISAFFPNATNDPRVGFMTETRPEVHAATDQLRLTLVYESAT
ncbi:hypothetical protein [Streptomyces sp. NBC_00645]|uniref:hypothetical protein n=1 Tax=Streptomyces sp. NBC_00645 TaxID=2975795 RepID=UPI003244A967